MKFQVNRVQIITVNKKQKETYISWTMMHSLKINFYW